MIDTFVFIFTLKYETLTQNKAYRFLKLGEIYL